MAGIKLFSLLRARAFVARLEVDVGRTSICYACLSFVSFPLDEGDERRALNEARKMTPILWDEGLRDASTRWRRSDTRCRPAWPRPRLRSQTSS